MTKHVSILLKPIVEGIVNPLGSLSTLGVRPTVLDCTFGGGGHSLGIVEELEKQGLKNVQVLGIDQDEEAIRRGRETFSKWCSSGQLQLVRARMSEVESILGQDPPARTLVGVVADLGFSSDQIEDADRGLSFMHEGPLDMRMDPRREHTALDIIRGLSERELADVIFKYGEERFSRKISAAIKRKLSELGSVKKMTTADLAQTIERVVPRKGSRIHPATRTFQALRILVNDEMGELDILLSRVILKLMPGTCATILTFHSLEDRKVKQALFRSEFFRPMTKKPIEASEEECAQNPRARSAKLRWAERLNGNSE